MAYDSATERAIRLNGGLPVAVARIKRQRLRKGTKVFTRMNSLTGYADVIQSPLSPSQLINARTANYWGLASSPLQSPPTYEQRRYGGLGAIDGGAYETVLIKVGPQHLPYRPGGLGRSFFGDIGAAIGKAVKDVGKVAAKVAPIVAVALPIVGSIVPGIGTLLGGLAGGLVKKASDLANKVKPALQAGGQAVEGVASQVRAAKAEALKIANDPTKDAATRAQARATYDYYIALEASINKAKNTLEGAAEGAGIGARIGANADAIKAALSSPFALPIGLVAVVLLTRRRGR